ncbi:hypothetical protein BH11MYX1_BH11MYX1_09800 [soil metagenome]
MRLLGFLGLLVILVIIVLVVGMGGKAASQPRAQVEQDMKMRFHMRANFGVLRTMERLLVHGKIDEARDLADAIAKAPDELGTSPFARQTTRVRERAAALASTTSVNEALREAARLAAACGSCHVDTGARPAFDTPPSVPADEATITARMARHVWASDRLWEGMLGNSDTAWRAGLDVLAATPLPASELGSERTALAKRLQRLATEARAHKGTLDLGARAVVYGDLLVTCAACHAKKPSDEAAREPVGPRR